jgi:DNA-binding NarL/FixJ family response regulator
VDDTPAPSDLSPESARTAGAERRLPMLRILIAEDVHVLRQTLVALLTLESDIEVVADVAAGDEIVPAAIQHRPDLALLDIDLPVVDGLTAAAELRRRLPTCRVAILTGLFQPDILRRALAAGVSASSSRTCPPTTSLRRSGRLPVASGLSMRGWRGCHPSPSS